MIIDKYLYFRTQADQDDDDGLDDEEFPCGEIVEDFGLDARDLISETQEATGGLGHLACPQRPYSHSAQR